MSIFDTWPKSSVSNIDVIESTYAGKQILVTGGASFIGSHLVDALLGLDCKVTVLDDFSSGKYENLPSNNSHLKVVRIDLALGTDLSNYLVNCDLVFHLAAIHGGRGFIEKYPQKIMSNLGIDTNVFNAAVLARVPRIVHASSACAYPISQQDTIGALNTLSETEAGEMDQPGAFPDGTYGWTKLIGEYQLEQIIKGTGTSGRSARIFTAYGERENESHAVIALIAKALLNSDPYPIWGSGLQTRNFTYVTDTVMGLLLIGIDQSPESFERINVGTAQHNTINDLIAEIFNILKWHPKSIFRDLSKPEGVKNRAANNSVIKGKFGWEPTVSTQEGLLRTINWYSNLPSRPKSSTELENLLNSR